MNVMGINKISSKKTLRRRSHSRKLAKDYIINIAEARREIVTALHLHRDRVSSSTSSTTTTTLPACSYVRSRVPKEVTVNTTTSSSTHHHHQYSLLMEPLPCPQPIWSTTPPSIHPAPPLLPMEIIHHEFEWGENLASSYTWWIGFLKSLDGNKGNIQHENEEKHPLFGEGNHHNRFDNSPKHGDLHSNMGMEDQTSVLDEWLIIPASDEISDQNES